MEPSESGPQRKPRASQQLLGLHARVVAQRPKIAILVMVALTAALGLAATRAEVFTDDDAFLPQHAVETLDTIRSEFPSVARRPAQIVVRADNVLAPNVVAELVALEDDILSEDAVTGALVAEAPLASFASAVKPSLDAGLGTAGETGTEILDSLPDQTRGLVDDLTASTAEPGALDAGLVVVGFDLTRPEDQLETAELALAELVSAHDFGDTSVTLLTRTMVEEDYGVLRDATSRLFAFMFVLVIVVLALVYRSVSDVLIGVVSLVFTVIWLFGFGALLGPNFLGLIGPINNMALALPILLLGLAVDDGIHLIGRYREELGAQTGRLRPARAGRPALVAVGAALALTSVTTALSFLTNAASPLVGMRDFGVLAAVGVISALVVMATFVPAMRIFIDGRRVQRNKPVRTRAVVDAIPGAGRLLAAVSRVPLRRPKTTIAFFAAVTVIAAIISVNLPISFDQRDFLAPTTTSYKVIGFLNDHFPDQGGATNVLIEADFSKPETITALRVFESNLAGLDTVEFDQRKSIVRLIDDWSSGDAEVARLAAAPATDRDVDRLLSRLEELDRAHFEAVIEPRHRRLGLLVLPVDAIPDGVVLARRDAIIEAARPLEELGAEIAPTDGPILTQTAITALQVTQVTGVLLTAAAAALLLAIAFRRRSGRALIGLIAIIPVAVVVAWIFAIMTLLGISFNAMTALVGILTIGIGIDYSIHVISRYLEERDRYDTAADVLEATMVHTGGALVGAALTTMLGFAVLLFSPLGPVRELGGLMVLTIAFSLLSAVLILPIMLSVAVPVRGRKPDSDKELVGAANP